MSVVEFLHETYPWWGIAAALLVLVVAWGLCIVIAAGLKRAGR